MSNINVAVVGATGAVGEIMLEILAERDFPVNELLLQSRSEISETRQRYTAQCSCVFN